MGYEILTPAQIAKRHYEEKVRATIDTFKAYARHPGVEAIGVKGDGLNRFVPHLKKNFGFAANDPNGTYQKLRGVILAPTGEAYGLIEATGMQGHHRRNPDTAAFVSHFSYRDGRRASIVGEITRGGVLDISPSDEAMEFSPDFTHWRTELSIDPSGRMHLEHFGEKGAMLLIPKETGPEPPAIPHELWAPPSASVAILLGSTAVGVASVSA